MKALAVIFAFLMLLPAFSQAAPTTGDVEFKVFGALSGTKYYRPDYSRINGPANVSEIWAFDAAGLPATYTLPGLETLWSVNLLASGELDSLAELNSLIADADLASLAGAETLTNKTLTAPVISGAISFPDGTRQTFNPNGTNAGFNVGAQSGAPSSPANGDMYYDSGTDEFFARIAGAWVALGAGGGGGSGDITAVGDVSTGAAFTGSAGTTLTFDDPDGDKTLIYHTTDNVFRVNAAFEVPAEAYDASGWNGDAGAPQKDAVRDEMELRQPLDADLTDLADGSLDGSKVGTGIDGGNVSTGTVADARIASTITRDTEWDTIAEIETATSVNILVSTELDSIAELEALLGSVNVILATEIDTLAELETLQGGINIIAATELDTSAEIATLVTDETGTAGKLVFNTNPVFEGSVGIGTAGVSLIPDGDGGISFAADGNGSDESFKIDLDNTSNTAVFSSASGLSRFDFGTNSINVKVPDEAYDATSWNANNDVPTKNAVRDKIESLSGADGTSIKYLSADVSGVTSTTPADAFGVAVAASKTYRFKVYALYTSSTTTEGCKIQMTAPASSTGMYLQKANNTTSAETFKYSTSFSDTLTATTGPGSGITWSITVEGIVTTSGTSGTLMFQFAAETGSAATAGLMKGGYIEIHEASAY